MNTTRLVREVWRNGDWHYDGFVIVPDQDAYEWDGKERTEGIKVYRYKAVWLRPFEAFK